MKKRNGILRALIVLLWAALLCSAALSEDFALDGEDVFLPPGSPPQVTEWSYLSDSLRIEISFFRYEDSDVYVADVTVRSLSQLRRGFGGGSWGKKSRKLSAIAQEGGAVLALTGDSSQNLTQGAVIGNGELLRGTTNRKRQVCVIGRDGAMRILDGKTLTREDITELDAWQAFLFGPALLDDNGKAMTEFESQVKPANPRAVLGYYTPGHYALIQVDGRGVKGRSGLKSTGLTMKKLSALMEELGLTQAYNLDGGQSAMMWFNDQVISSPYHGGRAVGDAVLILDGTE